ncbi:MAG: hypothetical protein L3J84_01805 [Gammaproteobacteria bacterium]|nr:hypothetical protein [Gammaproteobacteria bacterium]
MSDNINDTRKAYIAGIGMITSIGADTEMTAAAINADYSGYRISGYRTRKGQPITLAEVPDELFSTFPEGINGGDHYSDHSDRMIKMSLIAINEALATPTGNQTITQPIPLVLVMPEPQTNVDDIDYSLLIKNLIKYGELPLSPELVTRTHTGRAGGIQGLDWVFRYLYELDYDYVLLGGSDCYLNHPRLEQLDAAQRLLAPGVMDGFTPGEGAGFLLLTRHPQQALSQNNHIIALHPPGIGEEPGHLHDDSDRPYRGDGLDQAFKKALVENPGNNIHTIYSSMNGEHYWAKECSVALLRNEAHLQERITVAHPADCYGDLGAATGSVLIGLAAQQLLKQPGPATHLVYSSADGPLRAAVRVEKIAQPIGQRSSSHERT